MSQVRIWFTSDSIHHEESGMIRVYMHVLKTFEFFESNRDFEFIIEFESNRRDPKFEIFESNPSQIRFDSITSLFGPTDELPDATLKT